MYNKMNPYKKIEIELQYYVMNDLDFLSKIIKRKV